MAKKLTMPKWGMSMEKGTITDWLKEDGEEVEKGEPVVMIESDKIANEVEAPGSGILRIVVPQDEARKIGETLAYVLEAGESMPEGEEAAPVTEEAAEAEEPEAEEKAAPKPKKAKAKGGRVKASPVARRLAEELGVELSEVPASGPGGRVTKQDVEDYHQAQAEEKPAAETIPFKGMRRNIANQMMKSLETMAQVTMVAKADVTELISTRKALNERLGRKVSYTDLLIKAAVVALKDHPLLGAKLEGDEIVLPTEFNIGVAVALEDGLIVPVVRNADQLTLLEIDDKLKDLAERARENALSVDEVSGATFTITNLGMYGIDAFTPVINPPEVAILGVGGINEELALINGQVTARSKMTFSLTVDHRIVDGAPGADFLRTFIKLLESPALIFA